MRRRRPSAGAWPGNTCTSHHHAGRVAANHPHLPPRHAPPCMRWRICAGTGAGRSRPCRSVRASTASGPVGVSQDPLRRCTRRLARDVLVLIRSPPHFAESRPTARIPPCACIAALRASRSCCSSPAPPSHAGAGQASGEAPVIRRATPATAPPPANISTSSSGKWCRGTLPSRSAGRAEKVVVRVAAEGARVVVPAAVRADPRAGRARERPLPASMAVPGPPQDPMAEQGPDRARLRQPRDRLAARATAAWASRPRPAPPPRPHPLLRRERIRLPRSNPGQPLPAFPTPPSRRRALPPSRGTPIPRRRPGYRLRPIHRRGLRARHTPADRQPTPADWGVPQIRKAREPPSPFPGQGAHLVCRDPLRRRDGSLPGRRVRQEWQRHRLCPTKGRPLRH
jgi:hypothetical protein